MVATKTAVFTAIVVLGNVAGDLLLKTAVPPANLPFPDFVLRLLRSPGIFAGVALLVIALIARVTLLSWADLSYVLPVTSVGYVLTVFAARWLLGEPVTVWRWAGTLLIVCGTALVASTAPKSRAPDTP